MNCLEFRRAVLADPRRPAAEASSHAEQCPACKEFLVHALETEVQLAAALRVLVPRGLSARLLDRMAAARRPRWLALAASLAAAVAITLGLVWPRSDAMALAGIDFVVFEEAQAIADAKPTDMKALTAVARKMGVALPEQLGKVYYVCVYPFVGGASHHLLVKTPLGKVTLLLIPERPLATPAAGTAYGLKAAVLPALTGSIVIIGESVRSIGRVETLLKSG
jgi:hypothetical protein